MFNSPLLLGFDQLERTLDRIAKTSGDGYPPYNVEELSDEHLRITLAVAGFGEDDLSIQIENNQLTVRGKQTDDQERRFLHRGIAARQFQRSFMLADGIEVDGATLDRGLLHIDLKRPLSEPAVKTVKIRTFGDKTPKTLEGQAQKTAPKTVEQAGQQAKSEATGNDQ